MLKKALKDNENKYFVLLSGRCIPLYDYSKTYKMITSDTRARLYYEKIDGNVFKIENNI